ncbi:MAG: hypothetical protein L0Z62_28390 [Gemmataceae bacterium]|nr:hypothetical protein [Gemmataceae bacterium]
MSDYDSPWKEALDLYFAQFLAFFFPQAHAEIDWARGYESLDKELQQVAPGGETGRRLVDKLVKVWLKDGREAWILIHVEVQSQEEADFPQRMYVYNYRLFDRYNRTVVSLAVLGDDRAGWRPSHFGYGLWGCNVRIDFPVVKLLDYAAAWQVLEADPNPFATVVLAHLKAQETRKDPASRHDWKLRLVKGLYDKGYTREHVRQLFRFIDWMMDLPQALDGLFSQEIAQYEEEKKMPFIDLFERTGIKKGQVGAFLEAMEEMLVMRFGEEGLRLLPEIRAIQDLEVLQAVVRGVRTATTPDDLRKLWTGPREASA